MDDVGPETDQNSDRFRDRQRNAIIVIVFAFALFNIFAGRMLWFEDSGDLLVLAATAPQATLIGLWFTLLETGRGSRAPWVTKIIDWFLRLSWMSVLLAAMLISINHTDTDGYMWSELLRLTVQPFVVAVVIGCIARTVDVRIVAAGGEKSDASQYTITDLATCAALPVLTIAIFQRLPPLDSVDSSVVRIYYWTPIFAPILSSIAACLATRNRRRVLVQTAIMTALVLSITLFDACLMLGSFTSWWWLRHLRSLAFVYSSTMIIMWIVARFLRYVGFRCETSAEWCDKTSA